MIKDAGTTLLATYLQAKKNWDNCYEIIQSKEEPLPKYMRLATVKRKEYCVLLDKNFPERLSKCYRPTFAFKYRGDLDSLTDKHTLVLNPKGFKLKKHQYCYIESIPTATDGKFELKFSDSDVVITVVNMEEAVKVAAAYSNSVLVDKTISDDHLVMITVYFKPFEVFVKPTIRRSKSNSLIKIGANLYDCEGDLDEN